MFLFSVIESPVEIIKRLFSQTENVILFLKNVVRVPISQKLEPSNSKSINEFFPVQFGKTEAKYLSVLLAYLLDKSLTSVAVVYPLSLPKESKGWE